MKRRMSVLIAMLLVTVALAASQDSVAGTWNLQVVFDQGSGAPTVVFKQDGEKLTGTPAGWVVEPVFVTVEPASTP